MWTGMAENVIRDKQRTLVTISIIVKEEYNIVDGRKIMSGILVHVVANLPKIMR